jgi:hypothetical protein
LSFCLFGKICSQKTLNKRTVAKIKKELTMG